MNFKNISTLLLAGTLVLAACKKEGVNDDILDVPHYSEFGTANLTGKYYILNSPSSQFKIPVGITNVSNEDRTIVFTITSPTGAVAGTHYTAPTSIVIPAGEALDSLAVHGIFANYPIGRRDTLHIDITGGDVDVNNYNNRYTLILEKYCDVILTDLDGVYTQTRYRNSIGGGAVGPFAINFGAVTSTGPTSGTMTITGLRLMNFGVPLDPIEIELDWADPANFKATIPLQYTGWDYDTDQPILIRTSPGVTNTFSSCGQTFTLLVDWIVDNYPAPGSAAFYEQEYSINIAR